MSNIPQHQQQVVKLQSKLTETQINELKRAFAVLDKDGSGSISREELAILITKLDPSHGLVVGEHEVNALMRIMDKNNDGKVQLDEFLQTMSDWLASDAGGKGGIHKKRKRETKEELREDIHRKISKFFLQFRANNQFDSIRNNVNTQFQTNSEFQLRAPEEDVEMNESGQISEQERRQVYDKMKNEINLAENITKMMNSNVQDAVIYLHQCVKILNIMYLFKTPAERREIAEDLFAIFHAFIPTVPRLIQFAIFTQSPALQEEALRALRTLLPGPRVASTPETHPFHPSKMFFKELFKKHNGVEHTIQLLSSPFEAVKERAVEVIGQFCANDAVMRDYVLKYDESAKAVAAVIPIAFQNLQKPNMHMLRKVTWTLSILCGDTHPTPPDWNRLSAIIPTISQLLLYFGHYYDDQRTLTYVCHCISFLFPGLHEDTVSLRLMDFLAHKKPRVIETVLKTLHRLFMADQFITASFIKQHVCTKLEVILQHSDAGVRSNALRVIGTIADTRGLIQEVIMAGIVPTLLKTIQMDADNRPRALKVLKYLTRGNPQQIRYLVNDQKIIPFLCYMFNFFKEQEDKVLSKIYNFGGSAYNFDLVNDAMHALFNVLTCGDYEAQVNLPTKENPYITMFDNASITHLGNFLAAIKAAPPAQINAWRHGAEEYTIEDRIKGLLFKIKQVADAKSSHNLAAKTVSNTITQIFGLYYDANKVAVDSQRYIDAMLEHYKIQRQRLQNAGVAPAVVYENKDFNNNQMIDIRNANVNNARAAVLQQISLQTKVDHATLEKLFDWYKKNCAADGKLTKEAFGQGLVQICNVTDALVLDQMFRSLDTDFDGKVDFREFVTGLSVATQRKAAEQEQLLKLMFKMYDTHNYGYVTEDEVFNIFAAIKRSQGQVFNPAELRLEVAQRFAASDLNQDGKVDFEEFKAAINSGKLVRIN